MRIQGPLRVVACFAVLLATAVCSAGVPGMKVLDLVIDPPTLEIICDEVALSEETQAELQPLWAEYWAAIEALDAQTHQNTLDAGFQEVIDMVDAQKAAGHRPERAPGKGEESRGGPSDAEVFARQSELSYDFEMAMLRGRLEADSLLNTLIEDVQEAVPLKDDQVERLRRIVRRENVLRGFTKSVGIRTHRDFVNQLDLFELVEQASKEGGEIALLIAHDEQLEAGARDAKGKNRLPTVREVLLQFETQLDPLWVNKIQRARHVPEKSSPAILREGEPEFEARRERSRKAWSVKYDAFALGAELIRQRLERDLGDDVSTRWEDRVDAYLCPELVTAVWMDSVHEWLTAQLDAAPEAIAAAAQLQAEFVAERRQQRRRAILAGVQAMKKHGEIHGKEREQANYFTIRLELSLLSLRKIGKLKTILSPEHYELVIEEVKRGFPGSLGPRHNQGSIIAQGHFEALFGSYEDYWREQQEARRRLRETSPSR